MITLRHYQEAAIQAVIDSPHRRNILALPTGCGKTILGLSLASKLGARTLWIAHRDELISQPAEDIGYVSPEAKWGIVKAERNEAFAENVVFASVQTIQNPARLEVVKRSGAFGLVVADECHHATAPSWKRVLEGMGCFTTGGPRVVGLTATPEREDQAGLDAVFQAIAYQYHLHTAIQEGYLVPPTFARHKIEVDLDKVGTRAGDFKKEALDLALLRAGIVRSIVDAYQAHAVGRRAIAFVISIEQAEKTAEEFTARGIAATMISGETPTEIRRQRLRDFAADKYRVMVNCMVLTEGFNDPGVDAILNARPTKSKSLYIQCTGRGLRLHPNKVDCLVVDLVGLSRRHTLIQAPAIFGLEPEEREKRGPQAQRAEETEAEYWRRRLKSQLKGVAGMTRTRLNWLQARAGVFALPCGEFGTIVLRQDAELYTAEVVGRKGAPDREPLSAEPIPLELAQGIAEDYTRRVGAMKTITNKGGRWRSAPATPKQLAALKKWGVNPPEGVTKGLASDILTATMAASKGFEPATPKQLAALARLGVPHGDTVSKREAGRMLREAMGR